MRHRKKTVKLQRFQAHRDSLLINLCKSLINHRRIRTTVAKAKAVQPHAERLVTLGKKALVMTGPDERQTAANKMHLMRQAFAKLRSKELVHKLFDEIAVASKDRVGGYTRITKLGQRMSDSAPMAFIEWVDAFVPASAPAPDAEETAKKESGKKATDEAKPKKEKAAKKTAKKSEEPAAEKDEAKPKKAAAKKKPAK